MTQALRRRRGARPGRKTTRFTTAEATLFRHRDDGGEVTERWLDGGWRDAVGVLGMSEQEFDHQRLISPEQARRWLVANGGISDDEA